MGVHSCGILRCLAWWWGGCEHQLRIAPRYRLRIPAGLQLVVSPWRRFAVMTWPGTVQCPGSVSRSSVNAYFIFIKSILSY